MTTKNNPFSKDLSTKKMFDWSFENKSLEQSEKFSLQRYKELFLYFVSCFRNGKIEMLNKDLFNATWDRDYNHTIGNKIFHLSVNCYLYYVGYREKENCISIEQKNLAIKLLDELKDKNTRYFNYLNMENIKISQIQFFMHETELMPKNEIGKQMILPEVIRDFYIFSLFLASSYHVIDLRKAILKNPDLDYFRKYITESKKEKILFIEFLKAFYTNWAQFKADDLYSIIENTLSSILTEKSLNTAEKKYKEYKTQFSEQVLINEYKKQIDTFFQAQFSQLSAENGTPFLIQNVNILQYRYLTSFVDKTIDKMFLDAALYNLIAIVFEFLIKHKCISIVKNIDIKDTKTFLDYLTNEKTTFLIGSPDLLQPHEYRDSEQLDRYESQFQHIYTLGWFRYILALNPATISICVTNIKIEVSIPEINEMLDDFEEKDGLYIRKGEVEKFTKEEFIKYISKTYRNVNIKGDVQLQFSDKNIGLFIKDLK